MEMTRIWWLISWSENIQIQAVFIWVIFPRKFWPNVANWFFKVKKILLWANVPEKGCIVCSRLPCSWALGRFKPKFIHWRWGERNSKKWINGLKSVVFIQKLCRFADNFAILRFNDYCSRKVCDSKWKARDHNEDHNRPVLLLCNPDHFEYIPSALNLQALGRKISKWHKSYVLNPLKSGRNRQNNFYGCDIRREQIFGSV